MPIRGVRALIEAERAQVSLSVILADQAERVLEAVELVQTAIVERLRNDGVSTPDAFHQIMSTAVVHDPLRGHANVLPPLNTISIIDAEGNLINNSRASPLLVPVASGLDPARLELEITETVMLEDTDTILVSGDRGSVTAAARWNLQ